MKSKAHASVSDVGSFPVWSPDGKVVYSLNGKTYFENGQLLSEGLDPQWVNNESFIYKSNMSFSQASELFLKNGNIKKVILSSQVNAKLSPNKSKIAYAMPSGLNGAAIYICDVDGSNKREIYRSKYPEIFNTSINWSPDSNIIVFSFILYTRNERGALKGEYIVHSYNIRNNEEIEFEPMHGVVDALMLSNGNYLIEKIGVTKIPVISNGNVAYLQLNANSLTKDIFQLGGYDKQWLESDKITIFDPTLKMVTTFSGNRVHELRQ